ncbi:hypothetical protein QCB44_07670 [Thiomicrorhabdus sp. zzn3]|uniref:hypothetical protein n=1 Tax=Thiomicrorhabdus sp. zzn3 TaxID=3039775 RepID=UPI002436EA64|nr:hypothetical protein [Thiomicrorhabdus sp. zzn3]MDG6778579.1 hypothetical protein [Thiomicrorhabdus sp. zzn3]
MSESYLSIGNSKRYVAPARQLMRNGEKVDDSRSVMPVGTTCVYQVGKRKFARVTLK